MRNFVLILLLLLVGHWWAAPKTAFALIDAHLNYDGCNTCHALHGAPSGYGLLAGVDTEATCLACHGPLSPVATEVAIHDPAGVGTGNQGYISCRECHDAHDNQGSNIKLVGYNWDPVVDPGKDAVFADPTIRVELLSSDLSSPVYNTVLFTARPGDFKRSDSSGPCQICHTAGPLSGSTALENHEWGDCAVCHMHNDGFKKRQCVECHDVNATLVADAPKVVDKNGASVSEVGSHLQVSGESLIGLSDLDWTVQCIQCHTGHSGDVIIPNNATVGIDYQKTGGIGLGGAATLSTATSEADICWDCHAANGISEWGLNTDTNGPASNFNFGSLSGPIAPAWVNSTGTTGATWSSAQAAFAYKTADIQSTHSVNSAILSPGLDAVADIRCSYCHDVHQLNLLPNDNSSSAPYLRGTWKGNPYKEDGAPQSGMTFAQYNWGPVPRGSILNNEYGGYQIDQNNGNPTSTWTADDSAGLCELCHGNGDGSWDTSNTASNEIDNLNQFGDPSTDWVGVNGHSSAVLGGSGANARNIFLTSDRAPSGVDTLGAKPDMGYANFGSIDGYGFRGPDSWSFTHLPAMDGSQASTSSRPHGGQYYEWAATVDETTIDIQYHQFSCSKCHNPHASRLPRLLITNCLDTKHNTWDENAGDGGPSIANTNRNSITLSGTSAPDSWARTWSNTTAAQNCHRLAGDNRGTPVPGYGSGWNNVTPWN